MPLEELPHVDEHVVDIAATPDAVWQAALKALGRASSSPVVPGLVWLLGCDPAAASGRDRGAVGSTIPGFRVMAADGPNLLVLAGRHRFSRYGIVLRVEASGNGARCRLESRAAFPGVHGSLYRAAVVGTGGHVVAVRHLLRRIKRAAEQYR